MRTQLDDIKRQLKKIRYSLKFYEDKGKKGCDMHRYLISKEEYLISYINNIR